MAALCGSRAGQWDHRWKPGQTDGLPGNRATLGDGFLCIGSGGLGLFRFLARASLLTRSASAGLSDTTGHKRVDCVFG